ncbi:hypothetical protein RvY_06081-2 [Ramazzottius varieornatus]|uniref:MADF domain-containing protein n=1 Tax=Ramazzottius varieornatus TaxID=947166 RepID=A0A1D1UXD2_RAMVA|nr:hypothetical protein RvY_06081-2 [Ramazzottius varieornatus]
MLCPYLREEESVEECKKSWARLRMAFHREIQIEHRNTNKPQKQPWKFFHSLDFLWQDCRIGSSQKSDRKMKVQKPKLSESSKAARSASPDSSPAGRTRPTKKLRQGGSMTEVRETSTPTLPEAETNCSSLPEREVDEEQDNSDAAFQKSSGRISPSREPTDTLEEYVHFPNDLERRPSPVRPCLLPMSLY